MPLLAVIGEVVLISLAKGCLVKPITLPNVKVVSSASGYDTISVLIVIEEVPAGSNAVIVVPSAMFVPVTESPTLNFKAAVVLSRVIFLPPATAILVVVVEL